MASEQLKKIHERADQLLNKRGSLLSLWQDIAEQFYPERADFTFTRSLGQDFASYLDTSYPLLVRRDLGNSFSTMLRPAGRPWFEQTVQEEERLDRDSKAWLERATAIQRRAMYDRQSGFVRATKEGDQDFAAFGQCVLTVDKHRDPFTGPQLLYRAWHLRDVAWQEDVTGHVCFIARRWKMPACDLAALFPGKTSSYVNDLARDKPYEDVEVRHIVMRSDGWDGPESKRFPWLALVYEVRDLVQLQALGTRTKRFILPRWQTVSGSQYAYSPATVAGLPDARLLQAMTSTLLTAGEKFVDPPMVAVEEALRSDVQLMPGGLTWADSNYDQRLGDVLRPVVSNPGTFPIGSEMVRDSRAMLMEAFFLNKLTLPPPDARMTAYEASQRVEEYIRQALPLFEPMENDYNGEACDETFDLLLNWDGPFQGAFGRMDEIPRQLRGQDVHFKFKTPLQSAMESQKGQLLAQSKALLAQVLDVDPTTSAIINPRVALRDALAGIGVPARWTRTDAEVDKIVAATREQQAQQQVLARAQAGSEVAVNLTKAQQQAGQARLQAA